MFDIETLNELAPVQIEHRQINLEQWRAEVKRLAGVRAGAGVELGRKFREIHAALPKAEARREIEVQGFAPLAASALMVQAARVDGIAVATPKPRAVKVGFDAAGLDALIQAQREGDTEYVLTQLERAREKLQA